MLSNALSSICSIKIKKYVGAIMTAIVLLAVFFIGCGDGNNPVGGENDKTGAPLTGTVSITGTAKVGETLTADISALGGSGTASYQWLRDGKTTVGNNSKTYTVQSGDVGFTISVTVTRSGNSGSVVSNSTGAVTASGSSGQAKSAWGLTKQIVYNVSDGVVGSVYYEVEQNWIRYVDDKNFEVESSTSTNSVSTHSAYTITTTSSNKTHSTRNGQSLRYNGITESTTTLVYDDSSLQQNNTTTHTRVEQQHTATILYDLASDLILKQTFVGTSTSTQNNGTPTVTSSDIEINYTISLLSETNGVSTYKQTNPSTGTYTIVKLRNGVTIESSSYNADGELVGALTYTFPENPVIREKLPTFTLLSGQQTATATRNVNSTVEILSNNETVLVIRVKTFYDNVLSSQTDTRYERIAL